MKTIYTKMPKVKKTNFNVFRLNLMTIILLFSAINFSLQAQETFPPVNAPNGALVDGSSPVTININDLTNSAGIAPGVYDSFEVTVDWFYDNGSEPEDAGLTVITSSGNTDFTEPTNVTLIPALDATLLFSGDFASPYIPDSDGTLDLILSQGNTPNLGAYWLNIQVTIFNSTCLAPTNLSFSNSTGSSIQLNWTASTSTETGGYEYFLTTSNDEVPTSNTTPTGSVSTGVTSVNLTGLNSSVVYNTFVRTVCSPGNASPWSPKESFVLSVPELNWLKTNMDNAFGYTSTVDSQNNVIVVASGPFETQPKTMYVRKYDVDGNLLMQTSVDALNLAGGNSDNLLPYQVETDSQDNIIVAGVNTIINTSTSSSCFTPPCYQTIAAKIIKFAPDGQLVFNKTMLDHSNSFQQLRVDDNYLEIDDNDNIYYNGVGQITDTGNETAFGTILIKLAPDGSTLFTDVEDIIGNGNSIAPGLMALGNNFIAVVNRTPNDTPPQAQITTWDDNGNVLWNVNLDSSIDKFRAVVVDPATNDTYVLAETFPPNPILTKLDSNGNIIYTQTYSLGEDVVSQGLGFVATDKLAFAATTFSDLGNNSTLYTKVVNTSDGGTFSNETYPLDFNLSRVRDFETNPSNGSYYVAVNSTTNGGAPSSGTLHVYNINGNEWHATNPSPRVRSLGLGIGNEFYVMTDNLWDLYQYSNANENACSEISAAITNFQNQLCPGSCNGEATVELSGGEPPYSYEWSDPSSQNNQTATGLCDGSYTIVVTDNNNCTATATVIIGTTSNLSAPTTVDQNESCDGSCDGVVTVNPSGGIAPYTYLWSDPAAQTTETASDLCSGSYSVTVTDNNGCSTMGTAMVQDGPQSTTPIFSINSNLCLNNDPIDLPVISNNGVSGTWSGSGVITNTFDPASAGVGNHDIAFTPGTEQCAENITVTMTVEDCNCLNPLIVSAGDDQSLCADLSLTVQLNGFIQDVSGASWTTDGTGTFNDTEVLDATYTPSQDDFNADSVTLTLTTNDPDGPGPCLPASDQVVIEFTLQPSIGTYEDVEVCFAFDLPPISGDVTENAAYYTEPGGVGDQLLPGETITETTQIYVYDSTGQGCSDEEVFNVILNPLLIDGNGESLCLTDGSGTATWNENCDSRPGILYLYESGSENLVASIDIEISDQGVFEVDSLPTGTFDFYLKIDGFLQKSLTDVDLTTEVIELDFGVLIPGDINGDNAVSLPDFSAFSAAYGTSVGDVSYNALADFNCDGAVNIFDYSQFSAVYGSTGDNP